MSETSDSGMETFFFALYSIFIFSSGNIEHVALVNDLLIIRRETNFFFRRTSNNTKPEELIDKIWHNEYWGVNGPKRRSGS